ncbi:MAG: ImmA/IrrE family metallo-endopeptidase [Actinomycetota bacterium]|nr:ImmA/IrrE family metallo-endopeptidase [Actinomycetota bacterium]
MEPSNWSDPKYDSSPREQWRIAVFSPEQAASLDAYSFTTAVRPAIVLNSDKQDYYRQRFDAAHELGHLVMHGDSEPGDRIVGRASKQICFRILGSAAEIRDELPTVQNAAAWRTFGRQKRGMAGKPPVEPFPSSTAWTVVGCFVQKRHDDGSSEGLVSCGPGLIPTAETPSLLPRAVELLTADGVSDRALVNECGVPAELFHVMTSRTPEISGPTQESVTGLPAGRPTKAQVISLRHRRHPDDRPKCPNPARSSAMRRLNVVRGSVAGLFQFAVSG